MVMVKPNRIDPIDANEARATAPAMADPTFLLSVVPSIAPTGGRLQRRLTDKKSFEDFAVNALFTISSQAAWSHGF